MRQTSFHAYYTARLLDNPIDYNLLVPAFASSDIKIYPFQIAAAAFALRSPYQNGVLADCKTPKSAKETAIFLKKTTDFSPLMLYN